MLNRRLFLLAGSSSLATLASSSLVNANPFTSVLSNSNQCKTESSELKKYEQKIGDSFLMRSESGGRRMKLIEVSKVAGCSRTEQFSLVFNATPSLEEGLYSVTHIKSFQTSLMRLESSQSKPHHYVSHLTLLV